MASGLASIEPFSAPAFRAALVSATCLPEDILKNPKVTYIADYLTAVNAVTMVVEEEYVDADYLDDFAFFYAKSFEQISKFCKRLHFFSKAFDDARFRSAIITGTETEFLEHSYLGFVVARPLSSAVIGRTVLINYPSDNGRRNYSATQPYRANLFGLSLEVRSLAYQEQDTSLAACATVALWSCFQQTRKLFQSLSPTPVTITRAATHVLEASRPFPSRGLSIKQICNAIAAVGLDPEFYAVTPDLPLSTLMYSYLSLGIPILLVVEIKGVGLHAVAVNGYSLRTKRQIATEGMGVPALYPPLVGQRIDEFYAHDDQVGPFSRLKVVEPAGQNQTITFTESGCWKEPLVPRAIIIPVHPKIRIGFREVLKNLPQLSAVGTWTRPAARADLEWNVRLTTSNQFKMNIKAPESTVPVNFRERLLLEGLPKHVWHCSLSAAGQPLLEALLDSTAMVNGYMVRRMWWCDEHVRKNLGALLNNPMLRPYFQGVLGRRLLDTVNEATL